MLKVVVNDINVMVNTTYLILLNHQKLLFLQKRTSYVANKKITVLH